jgi:S-(hydroxymethyl)glutathione dehydrogenase/alcohol dehydrogenase
VAPGDHVVTSFLPACGHCRFCAAGRSNLCDKGATIATGQLPSGRWPFTLDGEPVGGFCMVGAFAHHTVLSEFSCVRIEPHVPLDTAALLACSVPTGWGSAVYSGQVQPGDTVVVVGCGGIGMNAVQGAILSGASRVIAVDPAPEKQELTKAFGATAWFPTMADALEPVRELTWGRMADKVIVCVGVLQPEMVQEALELTSKGGRVVLTGLGDAGMGNVSLAPFWLSMMQKELSGTVFGGANARHDIPRILDMYKAGTYQLEQLVTREYRLDQINDGYRDMLAGSNVRGLIVYSDNDY